MVVERVMAVSALSSLLGEGNPPPPLVKKEVVCLTGEVVEEEEVEETEA